MTAIPLTCANCGTKFVRRCLSCGDGYCPLCGGDLIPDEQEADKGERPV
jgi:hypothetical protein